MKGRAPKQSGVQKSSGRAVLIVDDDTHVARAVQRFIPPPDQGVIVASVAEARGSLATGTTFRAAVVDIGLPDGSGLDVVRLLREREPAVPILVLTARLDRTLVNDVHELGAELVCKPDFTSNLQAFFERVYDSRQRSPLDDDHVEAVITELALTPRERDIVRLSMSGVPRGRLAEVMGISENTLKKQVRSLLEKTRQSSLSEALWLVRTRAEMRSA
ncbi:MAG TPA: response regulator transcription factor [Polyangiaceae bacterium]|nr:response regulator transcription factor [Polyangiaceae bacterium]